VVVTAVVLALLVVAMPTEMLAVQEMVAVQEMAAVTEKETVVEMQMMVVVSLGRDRMFFDTCERLCRQVGSRSA